MNQVRLRRFARATNLAIPGREFRVDDEALAVLLTRLGARVSPDASVSFAPSPVAGVLTVMPDGTVVNENGEQVEGPGSARRIEWAYKYMPVTAAAISDIAPLLPGVRVGISLVLEPKTAVLALQLSRAGADVKVFGHAEEVRVEVADALRVAGLDVYADPNPAKEPQLREEFLSSGLDYLLDDGAHVIRAAIQHGVQLRGVAEETTSGVRRLREMQLPFPVVASNDARSKTLFDNAYGTGQSCLFTILDLLDPHENGHRLGEVAVAGYGDVGWGFARLARALGARVSVAEIDPVRQLRARMDGFPTAPLVDLAASADLMVSCTGHENTISPEVLRSMRQGAAIAVAGGVDQEVALNAVLATGATLTPVRHALDTLTLPGGPDLLLCDKGECINVTAGEGNPIEIMDLSFAVQSAALGYLIGGDLAPGLHLLPKPLDDAVAQRALEVL